MRPWVRSLDGAIALSVIAFLSHLGRSYVDWQYVYLPLDPAGRWETLALLANVAYAGGWIWAILAAARGSRGGWIACLAFALVLVGLALATDILLCRPGIGCRSLPNVWPWNWANLIAGLLAGGSAILQIRARRTAG
jgi:hypothetical protein